MKQVVFFTQNIEDLLLSVIKAILRAFSAQAFYKSPGKIRATFIRRNIQILVKKYLDLIAS